VYVAFGSIIGNTFVNEAAANTVGVDPPDADVVVAAADVEVVVLELLLLPQPTANAETPTAPRAAATRLADFTLNNRTSSFALQILSAGQIRGNPTGPAVVLGLWQPPVSKGARDLASPTASR
jgi:hypothetical protein